MKIIVLDRSDKVPDTGKKIAYLRIDLWNDYSFITMFDLIVYDERGTRHALGKVKIGFRGQGTSTATYEKLENDFEKLEEEFFSLGQDVEYYKKVSTLSESLKKEILIGLRDIVFNKSLTSLISDERVFKVSILRGVSLSVVKGQFRRVLDGGAPLTDFKFKYISQASEKMAGTELIFEIKAESKPSTNIHAVIGRNGVGKTTLLNGIVEAITKRGRVHFEIRDLEDWNKGLISSDYFSNLVSVSFSAFDPFLPPPEQPDPALGTCYYYIGIKGVTPKGETYLKPLPDLHREYLEAISICMNQEQKRTRWLTAIKMLESDENFADMNLGSLAKDDNKKKNSNAKELIKRMSSGHAVVLFTITKLVATVEEKTLVLIDEPESHLHPPLLSAFIRALSQLLYDRNGVAIIATHSPVVLQEIPQTCVWKIMRSRLTMNCSRPDIQTFGENIGVLTREIFGLEVVKSGFHQLLEASVKNGGTFDDILTEYGEKLGNEARAILMAMVVARDNKE